MHSYRGARHGACRGGKAERINRSFATLSRLYLQRHSWSQSRSLDLGVKEQLLVLPSRRRGRRPCRSPPFAIVWCCLVHDVPAYVHVYHIHTPGSPYTQGSHDQPHALPIVDLVRVNEDVCLNKCDGCLNGK